MKLCIDLYGNIAWLARLRDRVRAWSEEKHEFAESLNESESGLRFLEAGTVGIGAGIGELFAGGVSMANYLANWGSMATGGFGNDQWATEHAGELDKSNELIGNVFNVLKTGEGRQQLAFSVFETAEDVLSGDTGAISKTTGFFGQLGTGGAVGKMAGSRLGRIARLARPGLAPIRKAVNTTVRKTAGATARGMKNVAKKGAEAIKRVAPRITKEVKDGAIASFDSPIYNPYNRNFPQFRSLGINPLKDYKLLKEIKKSEIGRDILKAAEDGKIQLELDSSVVPQGLLGQSRGIRAWAYIRHTQSYKETARTLIHEGTHSLGVGGSKKAEVLARLAERVHRGEVINRQTMRNVLKEIRNADNHLIKKGFDPIYDNLRWKLGKNASNISILRKFFPNIRDF